MTAAFALLKFFGPWAAGLAAMAAIGLLVMDRNHLAGLNDAHRACMQSVTGAKAAKPLDEVCEPPIARAVEDAAATHACDHALAEGDLFADSQACSAEVKTVIAARDVLMTENANLSSQLAGANADRNAAVTRAESRARAASQGLTHAKDVLDAAPRAADGGSVCDAGCLRDLARP